VSAIPALLPFGKKPETTPTQESKLAHDAVQVATLLVMEQQQVMRHQEEAQRAAMR